MEEEGRESVGVGDGSSLAVTRARKLVFRRMLVGIKDGRFFLGGFYCIDKQGNIILQDAVEYRPTRRSSSSPSPSPLEQRCLGLILIPASCRATCHGYGDESEEGGVWQEQRSRRSRGTNNTAQYWWRRETTTSINWEKVEQDSHTISMDKLPHDIAKRTLFKIFEWAGTVVDVYVSKKTRKISKQPFAFVHFDAKEGALRAVERMNGVHVGTWRMEVRLARYQRACN
ncbi:hypothetical protein PIB30_039157 [Stylosanthes scabra]|uniref:RRM domain-containing protein n=1 Tax=Stylosanthes scabra TaxID=79078 RepID=A0ABU6VCP2_9FABA|nr:hypothetical protein [Stylosanthes scabra]